MRHKSLLSIGFPESCAVLPNRGAEQRLLAFVRNASALDVGIKIPFELVVARHFVQLTVFFMESEPPAFLLREVILDGERDDGPDAGEGVTSSRQ